MGSPRADGAGALAPAVVAALHAAAALVEEPLALVAGAGGGATVSLELPRHGIARARIPLAAV